MAGELTKTLPLRPADGLWLLKAFLDAEYPDGGKVDFIDPGVRAVESMWPRLKAFC